MSMSARELRWLLCGIGTVREAPIRCEAIGRRLSDRISDGCLDDAPTLAREKLIGLQAA
jgi:hypothetical protein